MGGFLERACADAEARVAEARRLVPLDVLRALPADPRPSLAEALSGDGIALIAEIKRASPSRGHLAWVPDPVAHALAYEAGGAAAISVLTEPAHFHGTLADLAAVSAAVSVPAIRKDFVVDPYQVWEARRAGAAAVLLIVAALGEEQLRELLSEATAAGLDVLVEVHDRGEAVRAAAALEEVALRGRPIVGVNARDLVTLRVDKGRFAACAEALPAGALTVAESGIAGPDDVAEARAAGADAVLVGELAVTAADPRALVRELLSARPVTRSRP